MAASRPDRGGLGCRSWLVFFAIVGGLAIFGAAGLILGPVVLALTDAILEIWRRRTAHGRPAEEGATSGDPQRTNSGSARAS